MAQALNLYALNTVYTPATAKPQDVSTATLIASRDVSPAKPDAEETSTSPSPTSTPKAARDAENSCTAHVDHLVVGAGVSRIGVTRRLSTHFPSSQIAVLEAKENFGGTWWTHTFPGIRSDSDLYSYGYKDRPWTGNAFATGKEIHDYLGEVIDDENLAQLIHYNPKVTAADWSSADNTWVLTVQRTDTGEQLRYTASFLWMCHRYYDHDTPYRPDWPGTEDYAGRIVHPENWPDDVDYTGKKVVVVGSGATAVTVCPGMAPDAAHVTMLQRTPSYFAPLPRKTDLASALEPLDLPAEWTHEILRRFHVNRTDELVEKSLENPEAVKEALIDGIRDLVPKETNIERNFTPPCMPWQQRLVVTPDGEFFTHTREGNLSVVTGNIAEFTEEGIELDSGTLLEADLVVSATGFNLIPFASIPFTVDGEHVSFPERVAWRDVMIEEIPNMAYIAGYLRASWTLRVDLVLDLMIRVLAEKERLGAATVAPRVDGTYAGMPRLPWADES